MRLFLIIILATSAVAQACPFCSNATASDSTAATPLFNGSIYFMLGGLLFATTLTIGALRSGFRRRD